LLLRRNVDIDQSRLGARSCNFNFFTQMWV